ncbi:hypothetical protein BJY04DRAFT_212817 [Aspergillus karnatakaensis]|uniref:uncharacterized protein n=1 Tax=Aspergillus karnatakaensis TaxID=1810916 RepID=UPI003CCD747A
MRAYIYRFTQEEDWIVLTVNGTRPHPDLDDVVGYFVNLVTLRFSSSSYRRSFVDLLVGTRNVALVALQHGGVPFDTILDVCGTARSTSFHPLGQVFVNYKLSNPFIGVSTTDFVIQESVVEDMATPGEIAVEAVEDPVNGLQLRLEFGSFLYGERDMEGFLEGFRGFVLGAIADHRGPVGDIGGLDGEVIDQMVTVVR